MSKPVPKAPQRRMFPPPILEEVSAGGIVVDFSSEQALVAVICRRNRGGRVEWCLPKGHVERGETSEQAAVREVSEETGITGEIIRPLGSVTYWFVANGTRIHKTVHHYLMRMTSGYLTVENDPDQEADDARWIPLKELDQHLSFLNEKRISRSAYDFYMRQLREDS